MTVSTPAPDGGLAVEVALSEEGGGDFTDSLPDTRSVTVPAGQSTASVSVATLDDAVDEPDGAIVARVVDRATVYTVGDSGHGRGGGAGRRPAECDDHRGPHAHHGG